MLQDRSTKFLPDQKVQILDGGLASTLQELGFNLDGDPLWSSRLLYSNPSAIYQVHSKFIEAGSGIIIAASYQASIEGFQKHLNFDTEKSLRLIRKSVEIAKDAAETIGQGKVQVAGSVGPYGACLSDGSEYSGSYINMMSEEELKEWHRPRIEALISAKADLLAIETIPSLREALCIVELIKNYPSCKAWVTFSCKNGSETCYGDNFGKAVKACFEKNPKQLVGIGINCCNPLFITSLLTEAAQHLTTSFPRIVYPNYGGNWRPTKGWTETSVNLPSIIEQELDTWLNLGVTFIGGCCRVCPSDIAAIAEMVRNRVPRSAN